MTLKRVFIAIDISDEARERVGEFVSRLKREFPCHTARWEKQEKLHITLKFIGNVDAAGFALVKDRTKKIAAETSPFTITIAGTGSFRNGKDSRVLWLGLKSRFPNGPAQDPFAKLAASLDGDGSPESKRKFRPHLTVERSKTRKKDDELIDSYLNSIFQPAEFDVKELVIYESTLTPSGSLYTKLQQFQLSPTPQL